MFVYVYKCAGISRTFGVGFAAQSMVTDDQKKSLYAEPQKDMEKNECPTSNE